MAKQDTLGGMRAGHRRPTAGAADAGASTAADRPLRGFISYSRDDKVACAELLKFLAPLQRVYGIAFWTDDDIRAGDHWDGRIREAVAAADIFLLLLTQNWLSSDYIQGEEVPAIQQRVRACKGEVISVILVPCPWEDELGHLQAVPTDKTGRLLAIRDWNRHHDGFTVAAAQIKAKIVARYHPPRRASGWDIPFQAAQDDPSGLTWQKQDLLFAAVTGSGPDDAKVAQDPAIRHLHTAVRDAATDLVTRLPDPGDDPVLRDIDKRAREAAATLDTPAEQVAERIGLLYNAARSLDIARDHSTRLRLRRANQDSPADLLLHDRLAEVATHATIWVRQFPRAHELDQASDRPLDVPRLLPLARTIAVAARDLRLIDPDDVALLLSPPPAHPDSEAERNEASRVILGTRNLLYRLALFALGFTDNATVRGAEDDQPLADRVAGLLGAKETRSVVTAFLSDLPTEMRSAFDRLMRIAAETSLRLPDLPAPPPWPPRTALTRWRDRIPGLPEDACPEMITIPAGHFTMGAPKSERDSDEHERPQRQVTVQRFALGRCAVTFAQWDAAREAGADLPNPKDQGWGRGELPVLNVSWHDAQAYCAWLNQRFGLTTDGYRLPSEAEWEYACRAGTITPFSFGATISADQVNYDGNYTYGRGRKGVYRERTVPVGSLPTNQWGLHEMHGNVLEWCEDWYGPYPNHATDTAPLRHDTKRWRVLRGGCWDCFPRDARSATRDDGNNVFEYRSAWAGFRVARTPGSFSRA